MKKMGVALASALVMAAGSASAADLSIGTLGTVPTGSTLFADYDGLNPAPTASANSQVFGPAGEAGQAAPVGTGNFYAVLGGGFTTYSFAGNGRDSFSLDAGSIDDYNSITLNFLGGASQTFQGTFGTSGSQRLIFTAGMGERITGVTLASSQNSFEVDNLAIGGAVPEPTTWAMLIGGVGAVGGSLRRRKTGARKLAAA